ncbi:MAG: hypothetical protein J6R88_03395 [Clostridia bacterium]|nr:hypothetical protein [Clostridia bacterium]
MLRKNKYELNLNQAEIKEKRKNYSYFDKDKYNEEISALNKKRDEIKKQISILKKEIKLTYQDAEKMIFDGIKENYSEIYERQLSRLYGTHVEIIVKKVGDIFDEETCYADGMVVTHDKLQHGKVLKTYSFGIRDTDNNYMEKKARVEFCVYTKAHKAGDLIPYNPLLLAKRKIIKVKYKEEEIL